MTVSVPGPGSTPAVSPLVVDPTGYATVSDYELRTGQAVPPDKQDTVQTWLNDTSSLIKLYLGDCEPAVAAAYPDVLTSITCQRVQRIASTPQGIAGASVGGTSVTYARSEGNWLAASDTELLDRLMDAACGDPGMDYVPGMGEVGVGWGGKPNPDDDVDQIWVLTGRPRP